MRLRCRGHRDGEGRVDAGSTHHGSVIAGGTDREAEAGAEEAHHGGTGQRDDCRRQHQLIPAAREAQALLAMEKTVSVLTSDMVDEKPITARLMV